jgi:hypothetical protein
VIAAVDAEHLPIAVVASAAPHQTLPAVSSGRSSRTR